MNVILTYKITESESGRSIAAFLLDSGYSSRLVVHLRNTGGSFLLNGKIVYSNTILQPGDCLNVYVTEKKASEQIVPVPADLSVVYEDEHVLVIDKPAGMPVHPSAGNYENTLANGIAWYFAEKGEDFVYRCINRLDRDTTGVLVLAKNPLSGALLSAQMKQRQIRRTYLALTDGIPPERGTVSAPIARMDDSVITREVNWEHGETAVTHYERLAVSNGYSLVELHLDTGRTHQIRVHMKYIGCPLPGDFLYHPVFDRISRQALHSFQLEFCHPITKKPLRFLAPVPEDFQKAFAEKSL